MTNGFMDAVENAPHADLQIMGLAPVVDRDQLKLFVDKSGSSILYVRDSGRESALA